MARVFFTRRDMKLREVKKPAQSHTGYVNIVYTQPPLLVLVFTPYTPERGHFQSGPEVKSG